MVQANKPSDKPDIRPVYVFEYPTMCKPDNYRQFEYRLVRYSDGYCTRFEAKSFITFTGHRKVVHPTRDQECPHMPHFGHTQYTLLRLKITFK